MLKKLWLVLLGLAVVVILGYIFWPGKPQTVCVEKARFCLQYTSIWRVENLEEKDLTNLIDLRLKHRQQNATFQIRSQAGGSDKSPEQLKESVVASLNQELDQFRLENSRNQTVSGVQSLRLVYDYSYQNDKKQQIRSRQLMLIVPSATRVYYITGQSSPDTFGALESSFNQLIERFRFIK